jgi:hypothetical protein
MPDWITHLGSGYLLYRPISLKDMRLLLLGAILPDIISRMSCILADIFNIVLPRYYQLEAFHTPFMLIMLALFISLFNTRFWRCFGLVTAGGVLHILLDMCDTKLTGFGQLLLYPFNYKTFQFELVKYQGNDYHLIVLLLFILLLISAREIRQNTAHFKLQRMGFAVPLLIIMLAIPHITWQQFWQNNVGYMVFRHAPERFENKEVAVHFSRVISTTPLIVKEDELQVELVTDQKLKVGEWVSIKGVYKQGKIYASKIIHEPGMEKFWLSLVGLILFPFLWFDFPRLRTVIKRFKATRELDILSSTPEQLPNDEISV